PYAYDYKRRATHYPPLIPCLPHFAASENSIRRCLGWSRYVAARRDGHRKVTPKLSLSNQKARIGQNFCLKYDTAASWRSSRRVIPPNSPNNGKGSSWRAG